MAHQINSVVCLDVETGGLSPIKNPICSVACISFNLFDGQEISRFETFVQPYADLKYEEAAMNYNGIKFTQLNSGLPLKEVVKKLCEQFEIAHISKNHRKKPLLMGHNIGFDKGFLMKAFALCKTDISKYFDCNEDHNGEDIPKTYDTQDLAKMKWGADVSMAKYNLTACCEKAGVSLTDAHNAMNDVVSTKELYIHFMNTLRSNSIGSGSGELIKTRPRKHFQL